jgi:hypothetical protein
MLTHTGRRRFLAQQLERDVASSVSLCLPFDYTTSYLLPAYHHLSVNPFLLQTPES